MNFPADVRYTKQHAWVRVEGAEAVAGITDHAQKELGDIVFVESPKVGTALTQGKPYGVVESVKSVSDLIAPLSGSVARVNAELANAPEIVNKDPYGNGWIVAIAIADPAQLAGLLTAEQYQAWLAEIGK
jgi:glycine cleavage system H protein